MRYDIDDNFTIAESVASKSYSAGATNGAAVDMSKGMTAKFFISVGTVGTDGTVDMKLQQSEDNSTFSDVVAASGNDTSITQITAAGTASLVVKNPTVRYYRVVTTVATAACVLGVTSVLGPLHNVSA